MKTENIQNIALAKIVLNQMEFFNKTLRSACVSIGAIEVTMLTVINRHPELRKRFEAVSKANGKAPHLVFKIVA